MYLISITIKQTKNTSEVMTVNGLRRLSKICCVRVLSAAQNGSVGRPVQNFVGFFKIIKIRLIQWVISSRSHSKIRRYALKGEVNPTKGTKTCRGWGVLRSVRTPINCSKSMLSQCSLIFVSVSYYLSFYFIVRPIHRLNPITRKTDHLS